MTSLEQMARTKLEVYLKHFPLAIALKKAIATDPHFEQHFLKVAEKIK